MKITKSDFGTTNTGENINIYHLENEAGAYVEILNFGCRLVKIVVPDRNGNPTDVCLGMDTMSAYENDDARDRKSTCLNSSHPSSSRMPSSA